MKINEIILGLNNIGETLDGFQPDDFDYYMKILDEATHKLEELNESND